MSFVHPWGLLALLAVPAILALHLLRHRRRSFVAPALFLLPEQAPSPLAGPRLEAFRRSLPLWLQLLAALLFTWLIAQPRWDGRRELPRVVVLLDSSASMQACAARIRRELPDQLARFDQPSPAEILLLSSDLGQGQLHRSDLGLDAAARRLQLQRALDAWQPWSDAADLGASLEIGRALAGPEGALVFVTDHDPGPLPFAAVPALFGEAGANAGMVGVRFRPADDSAAARFEVLLRNYDGRPQTRRWTLDPAPAAGSPAGGEVHLPGDGLATLVVPVPTAATAVLALDPDAFPADDRLPLLVAQPKVLVVARLGATPWPPWLQRLLRLLPAVEFTDDPAAADLLVGPLDPADPAAADAGQARLAWSPAEAPGPLDQAVDGAPEGLAEGLDFGGLAPVVNAEPGWRPPDSRSLAWAGPRTLISARGAPATPWLQFDFDLARNEVERIPALPVLVARFAESVRAGLPRSSSELRGSGERLLDPPPAPLRTCFQPLDGAMVESGPLPSSALFQGLALPRAPGFFTVTAEAPDPRDGQPVQTRLALHFAAFAEADLRHNASSPFPELRPVNQASPDRRDPFQPWLLSALALLLPLTWWFDRPGPR